MACGKPTNPRPTAQQRLIDRLAASARLTPGLAVLDVGCGMGGSTIELARRSDCTTTGLTLSPVQRPGPVCRRAGTASAAGRVSFVPTPRRFPCRRSRSTWSGTSSAASTSSTNPPSSVAPPTGLVRAAASPCAPGWPAMRRTLGVRRCWSASTSSVRRWAPRTITAVGSRRRRLTVSTFADLTAQVGHNLGHLHPPRSCQRRGSAVAPGRSQDALFRRAFCHPGQRVSQRRDALRHVRSGETPLMLRMLWIGAGVAHTSSWV